MSSTSETGHAKNAANFEDLLSAVIGMGAAYNPAKAGIKLVAMQTQLAAAKAAISALDSAMPAYVMAVDIREAAFAPLNKTVTKVMNMFKASVNNKAEVDTAVALQRKIQGTTKPTNAHAEPKEENGPAGDNDTVVLAAPVKKRVSTSQQSYDMRIQHFDQFIKMISANTAYAPNEAELKIAALNVLLTDLRTRSAAVTTLEYPVVSARINRNKQLYAPATGLVDTAADTKSYIKAIYGAGSPQVEYMGRLQFKNREN